MVEEPYVPKKFTGELRERFQQEWRDFGFHYISNNDTKEWELTGTRDGLLKYADMLEAYASDSMNDEPGDHEHFGPHMYLTVRTANELWLDDDSVGGPLADIARLAGIVRRVLKHASAGDSIRVREEYAPEAEYTIVFDVRDDDFDPASLDWQLN